MKKKIYIDFDGVLNTYTGWQGNTELFEPHAGAEKFLRKLSRTYEIYIFSTRNPLLVAEWLTKHDLREYISGVTNVKEPAYVYIDDRAINFAGNYEEILDKLEKFEVWWKKR